MGTKSRGNRWSARWRVVVIGLLLWSGSAHPLSAAVFLVENFNTDPTWVDRDPSEMAVSWDSGFGLLAGSMLGSFGLQTVFPTPETDAMRIDGGSSLGGFSGDYYTTYGGFLPDTSMFTFDFFADTVAPSDLRIRISDGVSTFSRSLTAQAVGVGSWQSIAVNLDYAGWFGGTDAEFSNVFSSITYIDIQISRSGMDAQNYYVDNFTLADDPNVDPPLTGAVPEPSTVGFLLIGVAMLFRKRIKRAVGADGLDRHDLAKPG